MLAKSFSSLRSKLPLEDKKMKNEFWSVFCPSPSPDWYLAGTYLKMSVLRFSCQVYRKRSLRSHILIGKLHLVWHASSSPWSSSATSSLFKMAATAVSINRRDVTANWSFIGLLPATSQTVTFGERSSDRLETVLAWSGDPPDSLGPSSPGIWPTSSLSPSRGRRVVCLLPSSSFSRISLLVKVVRSLRYSSHSLSVHSWVDWIGFSQDSDASTFRYLPEKTWHLGSRLLSSGFHRMWPIEKGGQIKPVLASLIPVVPLTLPGGLLPDFSRCQFSGHSGEDALHHPLLCLWPLLFAFLWVMSETSWTLEKHIRNDSSGFSKASRSLQWCHNFENFDPEITDCYRV